MAYTCFCCDAEVRVEPAGKSFVTDQHLLICNACFETVLEASHGDPIQLSGSAVGTGWFAIRNVAKNLGVAAAVRIGRAAPKRIEVFCPLPGCRKPNDIGVHTCWACGYELFRDTRPSLPETD